MNQDVLWARATALGTIKVLTKKFGWKDLGNQAYPTGSSDFSAGLVKAKTKGAQVILPIFDMPQSGILVKQWRTMKIPTLLFGFISPLAGPGAWKTFDGKIGGCINVNLEVGSGIPSEKYARLRRRFTTTI